MLLKSRYPLRKTDSFHSINKASQKHHMSSSSPIVSELNTHVLHSLYIYFPSETVVNKRTTFKHVF